MLTGFSFAITPAALLLFCLLLMGTQVTIVALGYPVVNRYFNRAAKPRSWWNQRTALHVSSLIMLLVGFLISYGRINLIYLIPILLYGPILVIVDAGCHRLPNIVNWFFLLTTGVCLVFGWLLGGSTSHILFGLIVAVGAYVLLFPFTFVRRSLGMGDVKLIPNLVALSTAASWHTLMGSAFFSLLGLGGWAVVLLARGQASRQTYLAVGPWVIFGTYLALLCGF